MNNFQRILDLVRRTGDKMVVTDSNGDDAYVVMDLDEYELILAEAGIIDGTDDDLFFDDFDPDDIDEEFLFDDEPELVEFEPKSDLSPEDRLTEVLQDPANLSEESTDSASDNEEEQFYLEPVE